MRKDMMTEEQESGMAAMMLAILLALLVIFLSGCTGSDTDIDAWRRSHAQPVTFAPAVPVGSEGAAVQSAATRTAWGTLTMDGTAPLWSLRQSGFGVFACHTGSYRYASTTAVPDLMHNQPVSWTESTSTWDYQPVVYWPGTEDGPLEYVSFFAYGPWSDAQTAAAAQSITDFSLPSQSGDPWLLYELAGTEDDWRSRQVDLVWAQRLDHTRPLSVLDPVQLRFRHALACAGDVVTLTPTDDCLSRLRALRADPAVTAPVTLTLSRLTIDYYLTAKGRLVLHSANTESPNWQPVISGAPLVHRRLLLSPEQVVARATSSTQATATPFTVSDQGIFFLPLDLSGHPQHVTLTAQYRLSTGQSGVLSTDISLTGATAGQQRDLSIRFTLPEIL